MGSFAQFIVTLEKSAPALLSINKEHRRWLVSTTSDSKEEAAKLSTFITRANLSFTSQDRLLEALTHKSYREKGAQVAHDRLQVLGKFLIGVVHLPSPVIIFFFSSSVLTQLLNTIFLYGTRQTIGQNRYHQILDMTNEP